MAAPRKPQTNPEVSKPRRPPATTPEARENQLIALAVDLAEEQLLKGTASAQVISHYLKMGSTREKLERLKLAEEHKLLKAKTESLESGQRTEEVYKNALSAMKTYSGKGEDEDYDD